MVGTLATAGTDQTIRLWDPATGQSWHTIQYKEQGVDKQVNALEFMPGSTNLAVAGFNHIKLFDLASQSTEPLAKFEGHKNNITAVGFHRDGKWMFSGSEDGTVKVWDIRAKNFQRDFTHPGPVNSAVLHPNQGEIIAGDSRGNVAVWDLATATMSTAFQPEADVPVQSISIAQDNTVLAAATSSGTVYLWAPPSSSADYTPLRQLQAHRSYILRTQLSPDAKYLATCAADKTVKVWDAAHDFSPLTTLTGHTQWVWDCRFSADSQYLVTASSDKTARLWELASGEAVHAYQGHHKGVLACALNDEMELGGRSSATPSMAAASAASQDLDSP
ncbi:LST8-1 [Symbiodinium sp. KB8]|nr:LST8-1 [Symbiodinium sp. KB8]